jgi:hypothetical protein
MRQLVATGLVLGLAAIVSSQANATWDGAYYDRPAYRYYYSEPRYFRYYDEPRIRRHYYYAPRFHRYYERDWDY